VEEQEDLEMLLAVRLLVEHFRFCLDKGEQQLLVVRLVVLLAVLLAASLDLRCLLLARH
tara:strand:+ start:401 stop:577 length:177 start_codon:yes stop_codon:yes gene_type:complete